MSNLLQTKNIATSEKIYGRNKELKLISEALSRSDISGASLFVIEGPAGIGKTSLIRKALEKQIDKKCFKLYGKFENHRENSPYAAFRQAFELWGQQILLLPDEEFDILKESTTSALQTNIAAVTEVFQELSVFFSRRQLTDSTFKADSLQVKDRFYYFIRKFFRSVTSLGYKLVIFIDDLQWADEASFQLLEELFRKKDIPGLLFVTAMRPQNDPQNLQAGKLKALLPYADAGYIFIKPLSRKSTGAMIPSQLKFSEQNLGDFKNYLWLESGGNPFRINEILKIIQRDKLIPIKPQDRLFWENLPKISVAENTVSFVREQLRNLSFHHLQVISTASCLGYSFESSLLKSIIVFPGKEVDSCLSDLTKMEYFIKNKNLYVFSHDTIFSAANVLLSNIEKRDIHQKTGKFILGKLDSYDQPKFFQAVNHLNIARDLSDSDTVYSDELVLLNIQAARLAIRNSAFEVAHQYFLTAEKLMENKDFPLHIEDPVLTSHFEKNQINRENLQYFFTYGKAETMFLLFRFEAAIQLSGEALQLSCTRHQRLKATLLKMMICSALVYRKNDPLILLDGIASLEEMLCQYGICIPGEKEKIKSESAKDCRILIKKASKLDFNTDYSQLINPDEEFQDLTNLVTTSMTLMYFVDPYKNLYMVSKTLLLTLKEGFAPLSPVLFAASFFTGFFSVKNRDLAHYLGKLSLKMIEREPFNRYSYMVHYIAILNFFPWENHYKFCVQKLEEGAVQAIEAGDRHYASFCHTIVRIMDTYRGKNLLKHARDCAKVEKEHHVYFISGTDKAISGYITGERDGFEKGDFQFPKEILEDSEYNLICRYNYLLAKEKLNYIAAHFEAALSTGDQCDSMEYVGEGYQIELEHFFFYSLSLLQCAYLNPEKLSENLIKVAPKLKELRRLSTFKSGNFLHKVYLIEAEIAKCKGDFEQATLKYDLAFKEAKDQGFVHHAAISAERAYEYYLDKNRKKIAKKYFQKSLQNYIRWGAKAKVAQLKKKHPNLLSEKKPAGHFIPAARYKSVREILSRSLPENQLGVPQLAQSLISLLLKEGQAKKGAIFLLQQNSWKLLAADPINNLLINKLLRELVDEMPATALNYCIHKGEKVILLDTNKKSLFAEDPYIQNKKPRNISIFPIKQSDETIGLIYLEDCMTHSEADKNLFLVMVELASTTFANAVYYENNELLNKELKVQERNRIEAIIESQEKERQRIARELHDSLGQILALTKITLSGINLKIAEQDNEKMLRKTEALIDESCREIRTISHNLMPPDIDNKNIVEILENLISKNRELNGVLYESHLQLPKSDLTPACKLTLYRVLQEIIQNIIKHASASKVTLSLTEADEFINLLVEDNGKGFDTNIASLGLGLKNIYSRVKLLDGYLDIDSSINNGTVFNVSLPINSK